MEIANEFHFRRSCAWLMCDSCESNECKINMFSSRIHKLFAKFFVRTNQKRVVPAPWSHHNTYMTCDTLLNDVHGYFGLRMNISTNQWPPAQNTNHKQIWRMYLARYAKLYRLVTLWNIDWSPGFSNQCELSFFPSCWMASGKNQEACDIAFILIP